MTKEQFERGYAERSKTTVEEIHRRGFEARSCDCGEEGCRGWQMVNVEEEKERQRTAEILAGGNWGWQAIGDPQIHDDVEFAEFERSAAFDRRMEWERRHNDL
jgi:hypothetical protein